MIFEPPTIFLDFDGVIANSSRECIDTAFEAFSAVSEKSDDYEMRYQKGELLKAVAVEYRYLVVPPEHFYCLVKAVQVSDCPKAIPEQFETIRLQVDSLILEQFKRCFFSLRAESLQEKSDQDWYEQNPSTSFIHDLASVIKNRSVRLEIVSRKDEKSLLRWISGSPFYFDAVYGSEALIPRNGSKFLLISELQKHRDYREAIYIDDAVSEQDGCGWSDIGVTPLIAGWGFNSRPDNTDDAVLFIHEWLNDLSN